MCFRSFLALIKCDMVGNPKSHVLLMDPIEEALHYYSNKLAENDKRLICILTKISLNQRKYWSKRYINLGPNTYKIVQAVHALSNRFCCSRYCTTTVRYRQNSGKRGRQYKKKCGPRILRMDKCPHAFLGCLNPKL